jgi:UDP-glucose 4-epimerase
LAVERAPALGFGRYIVSATAPFEPEDLAALRTRAADVVARRIPEYAAEFARRRWRLPPGIDRVYVNARARRDLGWQPRWDFRSVVQALRAGDEPRSALACAVGAKGYHRG